MRRNNGGLFKQFVQLLLCAVLIIEGCVFSGCDIYAATAKNSSTSYSIKEAQQVLEKAKNEDGGIDVNLLEKPVEINSETTGYAGVKSGVSNPTSGANTYYLSWGTAEMAKKAENKAKSLVESLTSAQMTDIEKAFVCAKYLNEQVAYGTPSGSKCSGQTAYEALCQGMAVCAGKSQAYAMMCYFCGINVNVVRSSAANHAWNQIELNGRWYEVDATNAHMGDRFLMSDSYNHYHKSDTESSECDLNKKYTYDGKLHKCTDTRFNGIETNPSFYYMDYAGYKAALLAKGINPEYYVSTSVGGINAEYTGETPVYENQVISSKNIKVTVISRQGNDTAPPTTSARTAKSSEYTLSQKRFVSGNNIITATFKSKPFKAILNIDALPDEVETSKLTKIKATYTGDDVFVGNDIDNSKITVIPYRKTVFKSGYKATVSGDAVNDFVVAGVVKSGKNNITVSYTEAGVTRSAKIKVLGKYPSVISVTSAVPTENFENGVVVKPQAADAALLDLDDGRVNVPCEVIWEPCQDKYDFDSSSAAQFTIKGQVVLPKSIKNTSNVSLEVTRVINVAAATSKLADFSEDKPDNITYDRSIMLRDLTDQGQETYYKINSDSNYTKYNGGIALVGTVGSPVTYEVKVYEHKRGFIDSDEKTLTYTIDIQTDTDPGLSDIVYYRSVIKGQKYNLGFDGNSYESSDDTIATVDAKGNVKTKKAGTVSITMKKDGAALGVVELVVEEPKFAKKIAVIAGDSIELTAGDIKSDVKYSVDAKRASIFPVVKNVITTTKKGSVKAIAELNGKKYSVNIVSETPAYKKDFVVLKMGKSAMNKISGLNMKLHNDISYLSSDESVATVSDTGKVTAVGRGKATIRMNVGSHYYTYRVIVF